MSSADRPARFIQSLFKHPRLSYPTSRPYHLNQNLALAFLPSSPHYSLHHTRQLRFSCATKPTPSLRKMSDEAYSSFLDQANQDTGASNASTQSKSTGTSTKVVDTEVPATLQTVEQYYTSEVDEPFEPVSLRWGGKNMPSESMFFTHFTSNSRVMFEMNIWTSGLTVTVLQMSLGNS